MASAVGCTLFVSFASADDLTDQRMQVQAQLQQSQHDLGESTQQLNAAAIAVQSSRAELATAQRELASTRQALAEAKALDVAMASKLKVARAKLARAKAAVAAGQKKLDAERAMAGAMVRDQYQQQTNLLPIAILVESRTTADLGTRLQWSTTMFDSTAAYIDRLTVLQRALTAQRARQAEIEKEMAQDRAAAAANLATRKRLERQAATEAAAVAYLVRQNTAAESAAAAAVVADRQEVARLDQERVSVERRIAARIAAAKAAVAEQRRVAAEERSNRAAARKSDSSSKKSSAKRSSSKAAKARNSAAQKRSTPKKVKSTKATKKNTKAKKKSTRAKKRSYSGGSSSAHHGFVYPVNGPITSPYGRRFHPILHVWKLHDGTDFGVGCGTPIRAAYSGRVAERYYNGAYGNRLMIDHGVVDGRYITTGYNHAQRYSVSVGEHVSKGEVIGYVGATGYATGCHLHLMLWRDGSRVNPMSWY